MQIFVSASLLVAVVIFDVVNAKDRRQLENGHIDNAQNLLFNGRSCESYTGMALVSTAALLVGFVPSEANAAVVAARGSALTLPFNMSVLLRSVRGDD
eukprot:gene20756-9183_t